jgi:hypothetical protein
MRWQRKRVSAFNVARQVLLGDQIRVADNALTGVVGLLGETGLRSGDGLLIKPSQGVHTWGMVFSIDVLVLDAENKVLAMRPQMRPFGVTKIYWDARAVLELPAGMIEKTRCEIGDRIEFSPIS